MNPKSDMPVCANCGRQHYSLSQALGYPARPTSAAELSNAIGKDGLRYTIKHYISGAVICQFDADLGKLWAPAWESLNAELPTCLQAIKARLRQLRIRTRRF